MPNSIVQHGNIIFTAPYAAQIMTVNTNPNTAGTIQDGPQTSVTLTIAEADLTSANSLGLSMAAALDVSTLTFITNHNLGFSDNIIFGTETDVGPATESVGVTMAATLTLSVELSAAFAVGVSETAFFAHSGSFQPVVIVLT